MSGPYATVDEVMRRADRLIGELTDSEKVALLNAHAPIGSPRTDGASASEQGDDASADALLRALNAEYERRFGFRFVAFVAGRPRSALVPVLRERLARDRASEQQRGIEEYLAIARSRLG